MGKHLVLVYQIQVVQHLGHYNFIQHVTVKKENLEESVIEIVREGIDVDLDVEMNEIVKLKIIDNQMM